MATCNDIDNSLAALQASNANKFAAMQAQIDQLAATQKQCCDNQNDSKRLAEEAVALARSVVLLVSALTSTVAGVLQQLAQVVAAIATLNILGGRIDALETGLSNLGNEVGANYQDLFLRIRNISLTPGPKGEKGDKGDDGDDGKDGRTPVKGVDYFDGAPGQNGRTPVKGVDYFDGAPGRDGYTPVFGVDYFNGAPGRDGTTPVKGVDYFDGAPGRDGYTPVFGVDYFNGADGADGYTPVFGVDYFNGADGADGYTPILGVDYFNGADGAPGPPGADGYTPIFGVDYFNGADGVDGAPGADGVDGVDKGMNCTEMQACIAPQTQLLADILSKLDVDIAGDLVTELCPAPAVPPGAPNPGNKSAIDLLLDNIVDFLISEIISNILGALIPGPVDDIAWRALLRAYFISRGTNFIKDQILQIVPTGEQFPAALTVTPQAIRPGDSTPVLAYLGSDNKPRMRYSGKGLAGINNQIEALSEQINAIGLKLCEPTIVQPVPKPDECVAIAIIPNEQYTEKRLETQLVLQYVPAGTTSVNATTSRWFIHVPNPVTNLTWSNLNNLDFRKGKIPARIWWNNGQMWTGSYFFDDNTADTILGRIALLSTDVAKFPKPRKTHDGSPKQQPDDVQVILWMATIVELQDNKIIRSRCIKRPN